MNWLNFTELEEQAGRFWHRIVGSAESYPNYQQAAITLDQVRPALGIFFRGLGGASGVAIQSGSPRSSGHRLTLRQRLGLMQESLNDINCNTQRILLPASLAYFPDSNLNRLHYFWLAAFFATAREVLYQLGSTKTAQQTGEACIDRLQNDLAFLHQAYWISSTVCRLNPGLLVIYQQLCSAVLEQRPHRRLPNQERVIEAVIRRLLGQSDSSDEVDACWLSIQQTTPDFSSWQAGKNYQPFLLVPLWGNIDINQAIDAAKLDGSNDSIGNSGEACNSQHKKTAHRNNQDQSRRDDPLLLNRFEKLLSWSEMVNVNRPVEDDDEQSAKAAEQAIETITLSPHEEKAVTQLKFDLDLAPDDMNPEMLIGEFTYPEWDFKGMQYHPRQCRVIFQRAQSSCERWALDQQTQKRLRKIRRQFETLLPKRELLRGQYNGADLDMDALVRFHCDFLATGNYSESIYRNTRKQSRDLSVAILIDVSLSTDSWIDGYRILDIGKEALITLATGLTACRDSFAIYTFTSRKKDYICVTEVKKFEESFNSPVLQRIAALQPGYYTRMGAALRHVQQLLSQRQERHRLLLMLTDGKPNDLDYYEGRYGIEDTRQAILEARRSGLSVFGITIDNEAQDYFPFLFGRGGYTIISRPDRLSHLLPAIYQQLIN